MLSGKLVFPAIESVVLRRARSELRCLRRGGTVARRAACFSLVSGTMNRTTDEVEKVRAALGSRYAGTYDGMPSSRRAAVLDATRLARAAGADSSSLSAAARSPKPEVVRLVLQHDIDELWTASTVLLARGRGRHAHEPGVRGPCGAQVSIPTTLSPASSTPPRAARTEHVKHKFRHPLRGPRVIISIRRRPCTRRCGCGSPPASRARSCDRRHVLADR